MLENPEVWPLTWGSHLDVPEWLRRDAEARHESGKVTYGVSLLVHTDRSALKDAYEEALDLWCYMTQCVLRIEAGVAHWKTHKGKQSFAETHHQMFVKKRHDAYEFAKWLGELYHAGAQP